MKFFPTNISKKQATDTGMAMVLLLLLLGFILKNMLYFKIALPVLITNMIFPMIYKPLAIIWLGLSHLLGTVVSKILLTIIFFLIVTPVGVLRRLLGKDSLKLKQFKNSKNSVMEIRNITFGKSELEKPF